MTTLTVNDDNIVLSKSNFSSMEDLYLTLQEKLAFEINLQKKAER